MLGFAGPLLLLLWMEWMERVGRRKRAEAGDQEAVNTQGQDDQAADTAEEGATEGQELTAKEDGDTEAQGEEGTGTEDQDGQCTGTGEEEANTRLAPDQAIDLEGQKEVQLPIEEQLPQEEVQLPVEEQLPVEAEEEEETYVKGHDSDPDSEDDREPIEHQESEPAMEEVEVEETVPKTLDTSDDSEEDPASREPLEEVLEVEETAPKRLDSSEGSDDSDNNDPLDEPAENEAGNEGENPEGLAQERRTYEINVTSENPAATPTTEQLQALLDLGRQININRVRNFTININPNIRIRNAPAVQVNWNEVEQLKAEMEEQRQHNSIVIERLNRLEGRMDDMDEGRRLQEELRAQVEEGRRRIEALEERIRQEEEAVRTFVMRLEAGFAGILENLISQLEEGQIDHLVQNLLQDFNVRLIGISNDLCVIMEVPEAQWNEVQERQRDIQNRLQRLFPGVTWQEARETNRPTYDASGQLQFPTQDSGDAPMPDTQESQEVVESAPVQDPNDLRQHSDLAERLADSIDRRMGGSTGRRINFDPQLAEPRMIGVPLVPELEEDSSAELLSGYSSAPEITSLLLTEDNILLMADKRNMMVKKSSLEDPSSVRGLRLEKAPWAMCILQDGRLAVTAFGSNVIFLIDIDSLVVNTRIETGRSYDGVGPGDNVSTLVVSCSKEGEMEATVDLISREGRVLKTITNERSLQGLVGPKFLFVSEGKVLVSDQQSDRIFIVDLATGVEESTLVNPDLQSPRQVVVDAAGNIYVACFYAQAVFVRTVDGRWRQLLYGPVHVGNGHVYPHGVAVSESGLVVAWRGQLPTNGSVVTIFDLTRVS